MTSVDSSGGNEVEGAIYEGLQVTLIPAPLFKRIMAYAVDLAIISAGMYALFFGLLVVGVFSIPLLKSLISILNAPKTVMAAGFIFLIVVVGLVLLVSDLYFILFESKKGYTPGKRVFGLRVSSLKGGRLSTGQCVLRDLFRYIDGLLFFPGLLCMLLTKRNQRVGDLVADTIVTHSAYKEQAGNFLYLKQDDFLFMKEEWQPQSVPLEICDAYLKFAYPFFFQQKESGNRSLITSWQETARQFIHPKSQEAIKEASGNASFIDDSSSVLLFFAELCFQTLQKSKLRSNK